MMNRFFKKEEVDPTAAALPAAAAPPAAAADRLNSLACMYVH